MDYKSFNFDIKASDDNEMIFEGYGSIFGNLDSYRDIVEKGAFTRTIKNNKSRIKILWQHDTWQPMGRPLDLAEDDKGLYLKGKLSNTLQGREAYILMKDKVINEMSIGYNTVQYEYNKEKDIRYLKELKLFEISMVTFGANDKAKVTNVKSEFDNLALELKSLRDTIAGFNKPINDNTNIYDLLLSEIKSGSLIKDNDKDKIENLIKALMALIEPKMIDSSQDTQSSEDNPPAEKKKEINQESEMINELLARIKTEL